MNFKADIIVYGGTSAAVIAAVEAKRLGKSVILVSPETHLGGLSVNGLGFSDTGSKKVIGGLARDFYHRLWLEYRKKETWKWQKRSEYGNEGQGTRAIDDENETAWVFEPQLAEKVYRDLLAEYKVDVRTGEWLNRNGGAAKDGNVIRSIATLAGNIYSGRQFIDATYEGDLLAAAGVSFIIGRESNGEYGEKWNGVQTGTFHHNHYFKYKIDPYVIEKNPASGLLPLIDPEKPGVYGSADSRVQAYCFRLCMSDHPLNFTPITEPPGYDSRVYEILGRVCAAGWNEYFDKYDRIPNRKTDTNNHGPVNFDYIGMSDDYLGASYQRRLSITAEHELYQRGLLWFLRTDKRIPEKIREQNRAWGLAADEFTDNGNWPRQLYIREGRRMKGSHVITEKEILGDAPVEESAGMGSYSLDSHNCHRYVDSDGFVQNEGDLGVPPKAPYAIHWKALFPKKEECANLTVPVCLSASHSTYGSIRMEPVFMILGQSAAAAAVMAADGNSALQDLAYDDFKKILADGGQVLHV
ncbi:MAG: FAD-dependent oxidoreductase [Treponema sp.]|nr:FAD-dependent oxidoreductase [Treponema sp.]